MSENGEQTQLAIPAIRNERGLQLTTFDDMYRFGSCLAASGLAPKGCSTPEQIVIAVEMGAEVGLPPMASVQNIAVINGRPSLWGDAMLGVCQGSGVFDFEAFEETDDGTTATCKVRRKGGEVCVRTFSMDDAKKAALVGKSGPWSQYPKRMRQMRARSWALRDTFADVLRGMMSAEEAQDDLPTETTVEAKVIERKLPTGKAKKDTKQEPAKSRRTSAGTETGNADASGHSSEQDAPKDGAAEASPGELFELHESTGAAEV